MRHFKLCLATGVLLSLMSPGGAVAQQMFGCKATSEWQRYLGGEPWRELPMFEGEAGRPPKVARVEMWSNPSTQTWTLLIFPAPSLACQIASGNGLKPMPPVVKGRDS